MKDERGIKVTDKDLMKAAVIYEPGGYGKVVVVNP